MVINLTVSTSSIEETGLSFNLCGEVIQDGSVNVSTTIPYVILEDDDDEDSQRFGMQCLVDGT